MKLIICHALYLKESSATGFLQTHRPPSFVISKSNYFAFFGKSLNQPHFKLKLRNEPVMYGYVVQDFYNFLDENSLVSISKLLRFCGILKSLFLRPTSFVCIWIYSNTLELIMFLFSICLNFFFSLRFWPF